MVESPSLSRGNDGQSDPRAHRGMPHGWRDVPMPPQIDALPRTAGGIPITYTVAWSSEHGVDLRQALEVKLAAAVQARDENARALPDLRDALRRILILHDDLLTDVGEMADKMALEARMALKKAGVRG